MCKFPTTTCVSAAELEGRLVGIKFRLENTIAAGEFLLVDTEVPWLVESIRLTTEWLLWGEQHGAGFVDLFCRHVIFQGFVRAIRMDTCPHSVKLQMLQSLSIIMSQLRQAASIEHIMRLVNPLFEVPPEIEDEEVLAYFVTLVKSVALRLNPHNVEQCLVESICIQQADPVFLATSPKALPVFDCAVKLVAHSDPMVQTAARTAVLSILSLEHPVTQMITQLVAERDLAPSLGKLASSLKQRSTRGSRQATCRWMWGDATSGKISRLNPIRWSEELGVKEAMAALRDQASLADRPVVMKISMENKRHGYPNLSAAVMRLKQMVPAAHDLETLQDFMQDLFRLDLPIVSAALQRQIDEHELSFRLRGNDLY